MNLWVLRLALFLYVAAVGAQMVHLATLKATARALATRFTVVAFAAHTLVLLLRYFEAGYTPVTSLHEAYSFFGWSLTGLYLLFQLRYKVATLGAFVTPVSLGLLMGAVTSPGDITELPPALQSAWLPIHVILLFVGYAAFALAAAAGVMYLLQEKQLKTKKFGALFHRLPNIDVLDEINYRSLTIGFPLLTVGIFTGAAWAQEAWGTYWSWDPKETWSLITWFLYAALLHGRLTVGWRGRRAAVLSILGFGSVMFTFLGVNYVLPLLVPNLESLHIYTG